MRRSSERILTTHAGSLPRPENLTDLFVRRARGESIDADTIAAAGLAAAETIDSRQGEARLAIVNTREPQKGSVFPYLQDPLPRLWAGQHMPPPQEFYRL